MFEQLFPLNYIKMSPDLRILSSEALNLRLRQAIAKTGVKFAWELHKWIRRD